MRSHRKKPIVVTPSIIETIKIHSECELQRDIAHRVGCSTATVSKIQKKHGFPHMSCTEARKFSLSNRIDYVTNRKRRDEDVGRRT
jgi:hypothetical protein